ncbi:MAG: hypothetical protein ABI397_03220 [Candidatus Saccharimonas sp.]
MKSIFNRFRHAPKRLMFVAALIAAVAVPVVAMAWGPDRPTFTMETPSDHITFDSITNNPEVGDERNFVVVKDAADANGGGWQDTVNVQSGHEYLVRVYVHNNAASNLNLVATNTRVMANIPTNTAKSLEINGFVSADNATPKEVWDQATLQSTTDFNLAYVAGSAMYYNNVFGKTGVSLSDNIVTSSGALVGYDKLDGRIPGCLQYAGYVTFKVKPQFAQSANFTLTKTVSKHNANNWVKSYQAQPGETVDYLLNYVNVGEAAQKDVVIKDVLPADMNYVNGSTYVANDTNPNGTKVSDNITSKNGINIGTYAQNGGAYIKFSATVAANDNLDVCGTNTLHNVARAETDFGYKEDSADVTVNKTCTPPKVQACNIATKTIETVDKSKIDNVHYTTDLSKCTATKTVKACNLDTKTIETVEQSKIDNVHYTTDLTKCASTPVTPPTTPPVLPHTGITDGILNVLGAGTLVATVGMYIASRRNLG